MKIIVTGLILLGIAAFLAFTVVITAPYYYYHQGIHNKYQGRWFSLNNYRESLLIPHGKVEITSPGDTNSTNWRAFQFANAKIPVPVKNPFFIIVPILDYQVDRKTTHIGLEFVQPNGLVLARVVFLPKGGFSKDFRDHDLFKIPIVAKLLNEFDVKKVWQDLFIKDITAWNIPYDEMIYNLYLLHKRTKMIHPKAKSFGHITELDMAHMEMEGQNKDFKTELVYKFDDRTIYGIMIQWRVENLDAQKLRYKLISELSFEVSSPSLTSFIYQEFQQLSYDRQVDHEGLAYLLAAWSHQTDKEELVRAMVTYMERGDSNERQLKPLYEYANKRYQTTFSNTEVRDGLLEGQALLNQKIEMETKKELMDRARSVEKNDLEPENLTPEQRLQIRIENAKKQRMKSKSNQIIMN